VLVEGTESASWSESSLNLEGSDGEFEDETQERPLPRFPSSSASVSPVSNSVLESAINMQLEPPITLNAFDPSLNFEDSFLTPLNPPSTSLFLPDNVIPNYCDGVLLQNRLPSQSTAVRVTARARPPPASTSGQFVQFFLHFHRQAITESHYFLFFDYNKFITTTLLAMAEGSDALRHAVVAFSALIYSIKGDRSAREQAFGNYEISLQQLRVLLDKSPLTDVERQAATVTALQLASFDVFLPSIPLTLALFRRRRKLFSTPAGRRAYNTKVFGSSSTLFKPNRPIGLGMVLQS